MAHRLNLVNDVFALKDASNHLVPSIAVRVGAQRDPKLRIVLVPLVICQRHLVLPHMPHLETLILKVMPVDRFTSRPVSIDYIACLR